MSAFILSQKTLGYDTLENFTATSMICMNHEPGPNAKYFAALSITYLAHLSQDQIKNLMLEITTLISEVY